MKLSAAQTRVLLAIAGGASLKSHRYLNGVKVYRLHALARPPLMVRRTTVDFLQRYRLIDSNKKFPSATYWLTDRGKELIATLRRAE